MKLWAWLLCVVMFLLVLISASSDYRGLADDPNRSLCCICACGAWDERKCSLPCQLMQHGHEIVNEDEMLACTNICQREGVKTHGD